MTTLGQVYRRQSLRARGVSLGGERILDVGCRDGDLLAALPGRLRIGVDLQPAETRDSVSLVQADGRSLPFPKACFDQVLALDVFEHVPDDDCLAAELVRICRADGQIFVTTPAATIRLFPPFLTKWISRRWGHHWRLGYTERRLADLMGGSCSCTVEEWNAPAYRLMYLFMRLLAFLLPGLAIWLIRWIAHYDAHHPRGHLGFYWMRCIVAAEQ